MYGKSIPSCTAISKGDHARVYRQTRARRDPTDQTQTPPELHLAHICYRATARDILVGDVADDAVEADPRVHLGLHRQDQLEQLVLGVGDVGALPMPLVDQRPRHDAARVDLGSPEIGAARRFRWDTDTDTDKIRR